MRAYLLILLVAAAVTYLATPIAQRLAVSWGAVTAVRERDVHEIPTPRLGGLAMLLGVAVSFVIASQLPFLHDVFAVPRVVWGIIGAAVVVTAVGVADDIWDLDWMTKLVGQVLAASLLASQGVQLYQLPIFGVVLGSERMWFVLTVLVVVVAMNAINFVDGLDGLAAGMVAIGASAFFIYSYVLTRGASSGDYASLATVTIAALVGVCLGFLPHNLYPARIFMGDSGSMLLGLLIAAAAIRVTGQIDTAIVSRRESFPAFLPIVLPVAVLSMPLLDMTLAVIRRVGHGKSPFHPDRMHLHHRMLAIGHSHRRAVAILYTWTAVFAGSAASLVVVSTTVALVMLGVGVLVATALTLGPLRGSAPVPEPGAPSDAPTDTPAVTQHPAVNHAE